MIAQVTIILRYYITFIGKQNRSHLFNHIDVDAVVTITSIGDHIENESAEMSCVLQFCATDINMTHLGQRHSSP